MNGPQPISLLRSPIDYGYYLKRQLLPMVWSMAASAGVDILPAETVSGQLELGF